MAFSEKNFTSNPFFTLNYQSALESLGNDYFDLVKPNNFSELTLRFRNNQLLSFLGLDSNKVTDQHFLDFCGYFQAPIPCLALRYHGHQFGQYNPYLGDGRGFLYGQVSLKNGLYDFSTKGSGQTPHSHSKDGRLTLEGGIREVLAGEVLHSAGVRTSRCLSLIETETFVRDGKTFRGSVMVRLGNSHLRFGTFERLEYYDRRDLIEKLLNHVIQFYYPHLWQQKDCYIRFYAELVKRTAELVAQWMAVGFCHGVLNTDNMLITGESFDHGTYAFINTYSPYFTATDFDHKGRYSYRNQPSICRWNLEMLQRPLASVIPASEMAAILESFPELYTKFYHQQMMYKLGFDDLSWLEMEQLIDLTLQFLFLSKVSYHQFFRQLTHKFSPSWREDANHIWQDLESMTIVSGEAVVIFKGWCRLYHQLLWMRSTVEMKKIAQRLREKNPNVVLLKSEIERIWECINEDDDWQLFVDFLNNIQC